MTKPRICLIYTGGTIGMRKSPDGALAPPEDPDDFLRVEPKLDKLVDLEFEPLLNKDSTNIHPGDWTEIATAIYERRDSGFDGFVIAHGTDTMHFSASAVAFALGPNLGFPVVFTGAQAHPEIHHGDARVNLLRACKVASLDFPEVVLSFGDYVFRGCRAQKKDERKFDAFESPAFHPLAFITEEIIVLPTELMRSKGEIDLKADFAAGILQTSLIPGLEPELLLPSLESKQCNGVILQSFGAGNVPHEGPYAFLDLIRYAVRELNKPVIVTSQFPANATLHTSYVPGRMARDAGAIATGNMTSAAANTKFRWALAQVGDDLEPDEKIEKIDVMMQTEYIGEMDKEDTADSLT